MNIYNDSINRILNLIKKCKIDFKRGNLEDYFTLIHQVNSGLTVNDYKTNNYELAIYLKDVFVLWNIYIDDSIDINNQEKIIWESFEYLNKGIKVKENVTQKLLSEIFNHFTSSNIEDINRFDYIDITNSFFFELLLQNNKYLNNYYEYEKYSTTTASLLPLLNIDYILAQSNSIRDNYSILRKIFHHLSKAIKFASDIGSLKRETTIENSSNSIVIQMIEKGHGKDTLDVIVKKNHSAAQQLINTAKDLSGNLNIDLKNIFETTENIVQNYSKNIDMFFKGNV